VAFFWQFHKKEEDMRRLVEMALDKGPSRKGSAKIVVVAVLCYVVVAMVFCFYGKKADAKKSTTEAEVKTEASKTKAPVGVKTEATPPKVRAIVICCSDPRLDMIDRIRERYGFGQGECFPIVVPGGPEPLANPTLMDCACRAEKQELDVILDPKHPLPFLEKVIVAGHEDCAFNKYCGLLDPHQGKKDFPAIKEFFAQRAPKLKLVMEYYSFADREKGLVNPVPEKIKLD
jgi:hypothetical protein